MGKILNLFTGKTKVDKQIDEMQMSIARELNSPMDDMKAILKMFEKTIVRNEDVVEMYNLANSALFKLNSLASDLKRDARL